MITLKRATGAAIIALTTLAAPAYSQSCQETKIDKVLFEPVDLYEIDGRFMREARSGEIVAGGDALECNFADHVAVRADGAWRFVRRNAVQLVSASPLDAMLSHCMCATDFAQEEHLAAPAAVPPPLCPASTCAERARNRAG